MKIAFYVKHTGFYEWVINLFTGSPTHCELIFSDGRWFSSSNRDGGTRFKKIIPSPGKWVYLTLPDIDESTVLAQCNALVGKPYDYVGILLGWAGINSGTRWFCSEVCMRALQSAGFHKEIASCTVTPHKLYCLGKDYAANHSNS